jgi:hypothetical protein
MHSKQTELLKLTITDLDAKIQRNVEFLRIAPKKDLLKSHLRSLAEVHTVQVLELKGLYEDQKKIAGPKSEQMQVLVEQIQKKMNQVLNIENKIKEYKDLKKQLSSNWKDGLGVIRAEIQEKEAQAVFAVKHLAQVYVEKGEISEDWHDFSVNRQTTLIRETANAFAEKGAIPNLSAKNQSAVFNLNLHKVLLTMLTSPNTPPAMTNRLVENLLANGALSPANMQSVLSGEIAKAFLNTKTLPAGDSTPFMLDVMKKMMDNSVKPEYKAFPHAELSAKFSSVCFETGIVPQERLRGAPCSEAYQSALHQMAQKCVEDGKLTTFSGGSGLVIGGANQQNSLLVVLKPLAYEQISEKGGGVNEEDQIRHPSQEGGIVEYAVLSGPTSDRPCTLAEIDFAHSKDPEMQRYGKKMCFVSVFVKNEGCIQDYHQLDVLIAQKKGMIEDKERIKLRAPKEREKIEKQLQELNSKSSISSITEQEKKLLTILSANKKELTEGLDQIKTTIDILKIELRSLENKKTQLQARGESLGFKTEDCELHEHPIFERCDPSSVVMNGLTTLFYTNLDDNCENALLQLPHGKSEAGLLEAIFKQIDVARSLPRQILSEPGKYTTTTSWENTKPARDPIPEKIKEFWQNVDIVKEEARLKSVFEEHNVKAPKECWEQFKLGAYFVKSLLQTNGSLQKGYEFITSPDPTNPEYSRAYSLYLQAQKKGGDAHTVWVNFQKSVTKSLQEFP